MKSTSSAFKTLAENPNGARYYIKILDNGTEILEDIEDFVYNGIISDDTGISIGTACSSSVTFSITQPKARLDGKELQILQGIDINGEIEYISLGFFKVLKTEKEREATNYECVDRMISLMEMPYFSGLTYPTNDITILNEICSQTRIALKNSANLKSHMIKTVPSGYTKREVIGYMAALQGKNAIINDEGNLELKWFSESGYIVDDDKIYYDGTSSINNETDYTLEYIECTLTNEDGTEQETLKSGSGITGIRIENPFMTQAILDEVFKSIGGFIYRAGEFELLGDFRLEVGDIVEVNTEKSIYKVPIMKLTQESDGGVVTTIQAAAESDMESEISLTGPIIRQMERYYADVVLINRAMINKLSADEADIRYIKTDQLDAVEANITNAVIENLETEFITAEYADLNFAQIDLANVEKATIGTALADVGLITNATIVDGHVTGYLDSVNINANSITAGDLSVERLIMRGSENSIVYALNNITGALQAQNVDTINGEILTQRTVTADRLVAKSITANEIAAKTITAASGIIADAAITTANIADLAVTSAKISSLDAAKITTGTLNAERIAASSITSDKLSVGSGGNLYATGYDTFESIPNTVAMICYYHDSTASPSIDTTTAYYGTKCLKIVSRGTNSAVFLGNSSNGYGCIPVIAGQSYIVSAWAKASATTSMQLHVVEHVAKDTNHPNYRSHTQTVGTSWTRVFLSFAASSTYPYISIRVDNDTNGTTLWVDAIQIEKGTATQTPSEFTPAGMTIIDGARILTGTVTANAIAANTITADKLNVSSLSAITANLGTVTAGIINMENLNDKTAYITFKDTGGYTSQLYSSSITFKAERETATFAAYGATIQQQYDDVSIVITRYATDYATDIAAGWAIFSHRLSVGGYNNTSYALSAASLICNSWIRTVGSTGWYNETYGGGWYMSDTTWIRAHNNKSIYTEGTIQGYIVKTRNGANLDTINSNYPVKYIKKTYSNVSGWTTGTVNYKILDTFTALGVPSDKKVVSINIIGWSGAPGMFNVIQNSAGTAPVLVCTGTGSFASITIQIAYQ